MDKESAFNKSLKLTRTPPPVAPSSTSSISTVNSKNEGTKFITDMATISCVQCKLTRSIKIRCGKCRQWWHTRCDGRPSPESAIVKIGAWFCRECAVPVVITEPATNEEVDITRMGIQGAAQSTFINPPENKILPTPTDLPEIESAVNTVRSTFTETVVTASKSTTKENAADTENKPIQKVGSIPPKPKQVATIDLTSACENDRAAPSQHTDEKTTSSHSSHKTQSHRSSKKTSNSKKNQDELLRLLDVQHALERKQIQIQAEKQLIEERAQVNLKKALIEADMAHLKRRQEALTSGSCRASRVSSKESNKSKSVEDDDVSSLVEQWVQESRIQSLQVASGASEPNRFTREIQRRKDRTVYVNESRNVSRSARFMDPDVTVKDFVDGIIKGSDDAEIELTKEHVRARSVLSKELPTFEGDPLDWISFVERFADTTKQCGYSESENLDRLARALKGRAYEAVRTELHKRGALASVLATLRMLFGRPEVIYSALVQDLHNFPAVTENSLNGIVTFSMKVKSLCDTLNSAELDHYIYNPLLVKQLLKKLPGQYRIMWGNFSADEIESRTRGDLNTFNRWLRHQAEIMSTNDLDPLPTATSEKSKTGTKHKKPGAFQGAHERYSQPVSSNEDWVGYCHVCHRSGHITYKCKNLQALTVTERWEKVRKNRLCIKCLGRHLLKECGSDAVCGVQNCKKPHHSLLHEDSSSNHKEHRNKYEARPSNNSDESEPQEPKEQRAQSSKVLSVHSRDASYKFQILPVILSNERDNEVITYAFLDNGSEVTLIKESLANKLKVNGQTDSLKLKWSNDETRVEPDSRKVAITIQDIQRRGRFQLKNVRTVKTLSLPVQSVHISQISDYPHLRSVPIEEYINAEPDILIGNDHYQLLLAQETIQGKWDEPVAIRTRIGWTIYGAIGDSDVQEEAAVNLHRITNEDLRKAVEKYFSLENIGITAPKSEVESNEDRRARQALETAVRMKDDGTWVTKLLWRTDNVRLPNAFPMALSRMRQFERKMGKEGTRQTVSQLLQEYHELGYLRKLSPTEASKTTPKTWYLPMFTVSNPNKPGKIRIVWDAAATVEGTCLNDYLFTGPDLLTNLPGTLFKFRERRVAVGGDIEKMFHQIAVEEEDQESQRCLWRDSPESPIEVSSMTVMTFGAACSPTIAQFVKNKNAQRFADKYPRAVQAIIERHYVDDYIDSFDTTDEAKEVLAQVVSIHQQGGFKLHSLVSNYNQVIGEENPETCDNKLLTKEDEQNIKVLGMWWEVSSDMLQYRVSRERIGEHLLTCEHVPTKRQVLRTLMMIFDPLGLIGFVILKGKLVLKAIWRRQTDWDSVIHEEEFQKWSSWVHDLLRIPCIEFKRWYFQESYHSRYELHVFVDAGEDAVAAVAYLVGVTSNSREVSLVCSKTKIGPNKATSIPRLELQAAVVGTRLAATVKNNHSIPIQDFFYWTDSRNVLCWIRSPRRFKVYVAHRIGEIREATNVKEWRYVPSTENPADYGTKWFSDTQQLVSSWRDGPAFLRATESKWPKEPSNLPPIEEEILEIRCNVVKIVKGNNLNPNFDRFSSFQRLVRVQAQVLRVFMWGKSNDKSVKPKSRGSLQREEVDEAEKYVIRQIQQEVYGNEMKAIMKSEQLEKTSKLKQYCPFIDPDGIIRSKSRLCDAEYLTYEQRCPIILPKLHHVTYLIVLQEHIKYQHHNHATVLNQLKQKYIIPSLRALVKSIRTKCWKCKKNAITIEVPEMSPLPMSRQAIRMQPFTYTGLDYFGPMMISHGRRVEKKWGAIFTCLTTRAIHLELASSLSSDAFLLVLRSFIARRGCPREIFCDNGTNFHGAENDLRKVANENSKTAQSEKFQHITWRFNPPYAPHMGGAWERLVKAVKIAMKNVITERLPSDDLMRTILAECEMLVNSRPLTYVSTNDGTLESLTPNHFILGTSGGVKPLGNFTDDPGVLRHEWKRQQIVIEKFWKRFTAEYLPEISQRSKWFDRVQPLAVGDVVSIVDSSLPGSWQLGRVQEVVRSKDGGVRQAVVKTAHGVVRRPASKLAILIREELRGESTSSVGGGVEKSAFDPEKDKQS